MPYKVSRKSGAKPWKIMRKSGGKWQQVGSSASKAKALGSVRARYANEK